MVSGGVLRESYDRVAGAYAARVGGELAGKPADRRLLDALAADAEGLIGDLGCGPGHVAAYLAGGHVLLGAVAEPAPVAQVPLAAVTGARARAAVTGGGTFSSGAGFATGFSGAFSGAVSTASSSSSGGSGGGGSSGGGGGGGGGGGW